MDTSTQAPATDDQELAKVLESMNNNNLTTAPTAPVAAPDEPADTSDDSVTPAYEETPVSAPISPVEPTEPTTDEPAAPEAVDVPVVPVEPVEPMVADSVTPSVEPSSVADPALENIKKDALEELRPLVDKLTLPPEEKFDTLLLIIRSTDDKSLLSAAHETAKSITDDGKRAEALLDIIKEIDYFSNPQ